jgi:glycosyltransferase involved in cell wall biosynthesis
MTEQLIAPTSHEIVPPDVRSTDRLDLEIIIPVLNEALRLPGTLTTTLEFLREQPWSSRVVIVDNGSVDDTLAAARSIADEFAGSVPIEMVGCSRPGKGAAIRRGLLGGSSRFVGFFDADLATPVETLVAAMRYLKAGATAVIASRHAPGSRFVLPQPLGRRAGGAAFRLLARGVVEGVRDTQCGFKFFERGAAARAFVRCRTSGFAFDVELLHHIQKDGGSIVELPIAWTDSADSRFHPVRDGIPCFGAVMRMQKSGAV